MAQRISRAKQRIKAWRAVPDARRRRARRAAARRAARALPDVQRGVRQHAGADLARADLSGEAIRLTRMLHAALPDDGEVDRAAGADAAHRRPPPRPHRRRTASWSRWPSRTATLWDRDADRRGRRARRRRAWPAARSASTSCRPRSPRCTTRRRRAERDRLAADPRACTSLLERLAGNPMVTLNRAVAVAMVHGPAAGLALLEPLDERLPGHHRLDAVRGHLLEMLGDGERPPSTTARPRAGRPACRSSATSPERLRPSAMISICGVGPSRSAPRGADYRSTVEPQQRLRARAPDLRECGQPAVLVLAQRHGPGGHHPSVAPANRVRRRTAGATWPPTAPTCRVAGRYWS